MHAWTPVHLRAKFNKNTYEQTLCGCESCLNLEFSSCKKPVASVGEIDDGFLEECMVDEDDDWQSLFMSL